MPSFTIRIDVVGNTRDMNSLEAAKQMAQRQATEVLANIRLLPYWGTEPPRVKLTISVNQTAFKEIPFIVQEPEVITEPERDGMGNRVDGEGELKTENPFETM